MAKVALISEQFQHFLEDVRESFWRELYGQPRLAWKAAASVDVYVTDPLGLMPTALVVGVITVWEAG